MFDSPRSKRTENDIVELMAGFLMGQGYRVFIEVCNMSQRIDIVARRNRWLTAIEVKRSDWRKALWQCRGHQSVVDFVCIAIGTVGVSEALGDAIRQSGYGLWHCPPGGAPVLAIPPKRQKMLWKAERSRFIQNLDACGYDRKV